MAKLKIISVVGARPNFMKIAPICEAFKQYPEVDHKLLHTGQHYDEKMSDLFFNHLGLPHPDYYLGIGSGGHGEQTGKVMVEFEKVLQTEKPNIVLVVGDVNSTIACALDAAKLGIKVIHVESGLRSHDRAMPEEINRILTDQISDYLFTTEESARANLLREGIDESKIFFVGNVMIDSLLKHREKAKHQTVLDELELKSSEYCLVTLHRPSNVDDEIQLRALVQTLCELSSEITVVFPVHPRTKAKLIEVGLQSLIEDHGIKVTDPMGYLEFMALMDNSKFVVTDSGGIQEETTVLEVPCITTRENTERPITCDIGTNTLVGSDMNLLLEKARDVISGKAQPSAIPPLWDGKSAQRIVDIICKNEVSEQVT